MSRIAAGFTGGFLVKRRKPEVRLLVVNGVLTATTTIIRIHPQTIAFGEAIVGLRMWVDNSPPIVAANFTFRVGLVDDLCITDWDAEVREDVLRARALLEFGPLAAGTEGMVKVYDLRYLLKINTRRVAWELHNDTAGAISYECVTLVEFIPEIGGLIDE